MNERSRSSRKSFTAISASDTGEEASLIQLFTPAPNMPVASCPASRNVPARSAASAANSSAPGNRQPLDPHSRRVDAILEDEIVRGPSVRYLQVDAARE